jgi:hypothetical protein
MLILSTGHIARQLQYLTGSASYTILPAYTIDGYITWMIAQGGITQEQFNSFIRSQVLPLCNEFPGPRSVMIMDSSPVHKSRVVIETQQSFFILIWR